MRMLKKIICKFIGHDWGFYLQEYTNDDHKPYKDVMYCKRCGFGDLRKNNK